MPTIVPIGHVTSRFAAPALIVARRGGFESWMRRRGKLGGQNKVPRMDSSGTLTRELVAHLRESDQIAVDLPGGYLPGSTPNPAPSTRAGDPA